MLSVQFVQTKNLRLWKVQCTQTPFKCIIEFQQSFYSEKICKGGPLLFSAASGADLIEMTWNKFNACSLFFVSVQDNVEMRRQNLLAV